MAPAARFACCRSAASITRSSSRSSTGVILCTLWRHAARAGVQRPSLLKAKARGADIRMVYSSADALKIARAEPEREVVFFAIGFETTTPPTAVAIRKARAKASTNFSVFCNHVLTPAAMTHILESRRCASSAPCRSTASSARRMSAP